MPRSLFLKIFLWFVTVVVTVVAGTFMIGELMRPDPQNLPMRRPLEPMLSVVAQNSADVYERSGQTGLVEYLERVRRESDVRGFLFNSQLQELSGQRMPSQAPELAKKVLVNRLQEVFPEGPPISARPVFTPRGGQYVFVAEILPRMQRRYSGYHPGFHLLGVALVGALFCYWLARHLTSPVTKLRKATQELAAGNLSARVAPALGQRRDELASLGTDFDVMAEKIETLINSQRRLRGDISHELRSPLARLNVALELARQRSGPEAISALERIQHEAENLNHMIGQLLALTRLESGADALSKTEFDLASMLREVSNDCDYEARGRNRAVTLKTVEQLRIVGTEHLLRRAVENVVRNAVQYTATGTTVEVELNVESGLACSDEEASSKTTEASGDGRKQCAVITVRDHGPGVPVNVLKEIFRPFYRVDDARDREAGGVGLGLAIAERAVRVHGGSIEAFNSPTRGLIVKITLPHKQQPVRQDD
ncbi:MAG TPA: ATP-binding protein [Pyrinomonadaceae bacterium]|nr:ATP-binding protein [Pyrinomonadaceae bacterium]